MSSKDRIFGTLLYLDPLNVDQVKVREGASFLSNRFRRNVVSGEANLTLTPELSGSLIQMDDATQAFVLPAITAANVGMAFELVSTVAATTTTVTAQAGDLLIGAARISSTAAGGDDSFNPDVVDDLILTMNGTTQGGAVGSRILLTAVATDRWLVNYEGVGSGLLVTPFS